MVVLRRALHEADGGFRVRAVAPGRRHALALCWDAHESRRQRSWQSEVPLNVIHPYDLIFVGLALDIMGAIILAKGVMFKGVREAYFESRTVFGGNSHLLKSALLQRAEAKLGAVLLVSGFAFQVWGNLHGGIAASDAGWINSTPRVIVVVVASALVSVLLLRLFQWGARVAFYRVFFRNYKGETLTVPDGDRTWLDRNAYLLDLKRRANESDADLLARVEARRSRLGPRHRGQSVGFGDDGIGAA
jgi:hypothetical protein